jgi:hypothetical protein
MGDWKKHRDGSCVPTKRTVPVLTQRKEPPLLPLLIFEEVYWHELILLI